MLRNLRRGERCEAEDHGSIGQYGTGGSHRRSGFAVWSGSQIGTSCHQPPPVSTGRYSVEQPHQSGMRSVSGGIHPRAPEVAPAESHRRDLAATGPAGERGAPAAGGVEPGGRGHSMIFSARARTDGGMVRPRAFAVFRLMASLIFVGRSTGRAPRSSQAGSWPPAADRCAAAPRTDAARAHGGERNSCSVASAFVPSALRAGRQRGARHPLTHTVSFMSPAPRLRHGAFPPHPGIDRPPDRQVS
jgi:hypothetical protein